MKKQLLIGLILLIAIFALFGCSDDECTTCPEFTQEGMVIAYAAIYEGEFDCDGVIYGIDGRFVDVDSIKVDIYKLDITQYFGEGLATYFYSDDDLSTSYSSGDTVTLTIYMPHGVTTGSVTLLERPDDEPDIYEWYMNWPYDTIPLNNEISVNWVSQENSDFYAVDWRYYYDSNGTHAYRENAFMTLDTNCTLPASMLTYNGYVYFDVYALTGPNFDEVGNLSSAILKGRFNSVAGSYFTVYVGNGRAYPDYTKSTMANDNLHKEYLEFLISTIK